ncbi:hypothetical protein ACVWYG_003463 [Pedobacter sp. UYEF25]
MEKKITSLLVVPLNAFAATPLTVFHSQKPEWMYSFNRLYALKPKNPV